MKTKPILILSSVLCLSGPAMLFAAAFDSGSDGSYGALTVGYNIITNLDMPPDGIFKCTTITIGSSAQVYFNRNARNTPVYLLAQSNVVIHGTINLLGGDYSGSNPGRGGPGGFDGGFGTVQGYAASDGQGPGGGKVSGSGNRAGVFAYPRAQNSNIYGNTLLVPLVGGSGGAGSAELAAGGGGGGGAIVVASSVAITIINHGYNNILARGGIGGYTGDSRSSGDGSGGAVRLVAPVVTGDGNVAASGGNYFYPGSPGRIRIDTLDRFAWRNISVSGNGEKWTVGSQMYVFPPNNPHLDIVEAAGQAIAEGTDAVVLVPLLPGASTNQVIKIKATGFTNDVPVTVSIVPEAGPSTRFDGVISIAGGTPVTGSVNVIIPVDSFCNVSVWTR